MTPKPYGARGRAGHARERQVVAFYREQGYVAFRTPASLGCADVIAIRRLGGSAPDDPPAVRAWLDLPPAAEVIFCEVKSNYGSAWMNFRAANRLALIEAADQAGATALLAHWPPHGTLRFYGVSEWPEGRKAA